MLQACGVCCKSARLLSCTTNCHTRDSMVSPSLPPCLPFASFQLPQVLESCLRLSQVDFKGVTVKLLKLTGEEDVWVLLWFSLFEFEAGLTILK
mgnify:CR=1 FL=1